MNMSGYYLKNAFFFSTVYTQYIHILTTFKIVGILHAMEICINLLISICWNDFGVTVFPQMHFISIVPKWIKIYLKNSSYSNYQWCWSTVQFNCFYTCAKINTPTPPSSPKNCQYNMTSLSWVPSSAWSLCIYTSFHALTSSSSHVKSDRLYVSLFLYEK